MMNYLIKFFTVKNNWCLSFILSMLKEYLEIDNTGYRGANWRVLNKYDFWHVSTGMVTTSSVIFSFKSNGMGVVSENLILKVALEEKSTHA